MIPEFGLIALLISLGLAIVLGGVPLAGSFLGLRHWQALGRPLAIGQFTFIMLAFLILGYGFINNDFSVAYIASNSNSQLPLLYKISALWAGHEGSLLLWEVMLCGWTLAAALYSKELPLAIQARVLSVMGLVSVGFLLFLLITSNPFARILPYQPVEGTSLNPLLQDVGLAIHPPLLYMGYVGFSVVYAFAIAALIGGRLDAAWARWSRPWTLIAWCFLTLGIAVGSWWAYYELGWGGWWFWDPVENASLMPWLLGTALLHTLSVAEKRGQFKSWAVFLAIGTFSLSLIGTFLVRSGVLTSVHAFAADPSRGAFILALLIIVVGSSLLLFAFRAPAVKNQSGFSALSLEAFLLVNNILLTGACAIVLLGTLYPLAMDALDLGKISVGPPFYNASFVPASLLLAFTLGIGVVCRWKDNPVGYLIRQLSAAAIASVVLAVVVALMLGCEYSLRTLMFTALAFWIVFSSCRALLNRCRNKASLMAGLQAIPKGVWGMHLAHVGMAVTMVGILMVSQHSEDRDLRMAPGDRAVLGDYTFQFNGVAPKRGPNYRSEYGILEVFKDGDLITTMHPEKRDYNSGGPTMTDSAIDPGLFRDLYVALGERLDNGAWSLRLQIKTFVRWIWLGALLMAAGALLASMDKRYKLQARRRKKAAPAEQPFTSQVRHETGCVI